MINQNLRTLYYWLTGFFMRLSGWFYRAFRAPRSGLLKVQLGPGKRNYLPGWVNLDANFLTAKIDVWADLRNPLPFHDNSIDALYSHHVIEHLRNMPAHLREAFRCLKPGGIYRLGGPNGDAAMRKYLEGDLAWFGDFPDKRRSIGGRMENFIFCRQEHLTILTFSYLEELLSDAGFTNIRLCLPTRETGSPLFQDCLALEHENDFACPHTLIVEAEKPQKR
ncbi:MAG: hypothetical protein Fur0035_12010 [Anaerolineales bacterium]